MPFLVLYVCKADERTRRFSTTKPRYTLGSAAADDLVLDGTHVLAQHCTFAIDDTGCRVEPRGVVLRAGVPLAQPFAVTGPTKLYIGEFFVEAEWFAGSMDPVEQELLEAAVEGDDAARLVYADWLEGNGQLDAATFLRDDAAPAGDTELSWRRRVSRALVRNCTMDPVCERRWSDLTQIGYPDRRRCEECSRDVPYVHDLEPYKHFAAREPYFAHVLDPATPPPTRDTPAQAYDLAVDDHEEWG